MKVIACLGGSSGQPGDPRYDAMVKVGRLLAVKECQVVTGGFGGTGMEAPAKGATEVGGEAIGYTMLDKPGNPYLSTVVDCSKFAGNDDYPLSPEWQYGLRLGHLLEADGFIIAAGGGPGSMVELMAIINFNAKGLWKGKPKRCAILNPFTSPVRGWDNEMLKYFSSIGTVPPETRLLIHVVASPVEAVEWVLDVRLTSGEDY